MKKKGFIISDVTIKIVFIVFVVVGLVYGVSHLFGKPISWAKLIPGFNYTESTEGMSIVGINLDKENRLEYFTGEKWKKIDFKTADDVFFLGDYEIKPAEIKNKLNEFYFDTPRKPPILTLEVNHWRYWMVSLGKSFDTFGIVSFTKKGYEGPVTEAYFLDKKNNYDLMGLTKLDSLEPSAPLQKAIEWRDSILEGGKCEKFLQLNLKKNKQDWSKSYTVRRNNQYVFVNLNEPVTEGKEEKWKDEKCFGVENYKDDEDRSNWKNEVAVEFKLPKRFNVYYFSRLWSYDKVVTAHTSVPAALAGYKGKSFYEGLLLLTDFEEGLFKEKEVAFNCASDNSEVFVKNVKLDFVNKIFKCERWSSRSGHPTIEQKDGFIYGLLNEYNKYFLPVKENGIN